MNDDRLLTTAELARALNLAARTVQHYRRLGIIEPADETPGGHARWQEATVRAQLREYRRRNRES